MSRINCNLRSSELLCVNPKMEFKEAEVENQPNLAAVIRVWISVNVLLTSTVTVASGKHSFIVRYRRI